MRYPDIYFEPAYAKLYEAAGCEAVEYRHECEYGVITNLFLKRQIPISLAGGVQYYDIITPYGYGGPVIHEGASDKEKLIASYMAAFETYTVQQNIVSEFVRFHPIIENGVDFHEAYNSIYDRKTVGTNLTYENVIEEEFSKHKRRDIKKLLKNSEIRYEIDETPKDLSDFLEVYYSTMDRDSADDYYYFGESYFTEMLANLPGHIITGKVFLGEKIIAMGVYFQYGKLMHAHLSGTLSEYISYSPANLLKYALAMYGHEKGYQVIHYGGGTSRSPENGLYRFKKEFGKNTEFDFYIGKKVWNEDAYARLCEASQNDKNGEFFPAYRRNR